MGNLIANLRARLAAVPGHVWLGLAIGVGSLVLGILALRGRFAAANGTTPLLPSVGLSGGSGGGSGGIDPLGSQGGPFVPPASSGGTPTPATPTTPTGGTHPPVTHPPATPPPVTLGGTHAPVPSHGPTHGEQTDTSYLDAPQAVTPPPAPLRSGDNPALWAAPTPAAVAPPPVHPSYFGPTHGEQTDTSYLDALAGTGGGGGHFQ